MRHLGRIGLWALLTLTAWAFPPRAQGDDETPPDAPPEAPVPPAPVEQPQQRLPPAEVIAPRLLGGTGGRTGLGSGAPSTGGPERSVVPTRTPVAVQDVPASVSVMNRNDIRLRRAARSMSGALQGLPGVLVQKTAPLQHSPFIRGFTAYHNLLLIDGIRLNNSTFRAGPNQYWATIDPLSVRNIEVARGPHSVLYGSDAIGGTVNVLTAARESFCPGFHVNGGFYTRYATAEDAVFARLETEGNYNNFGWVLGLTGKHYGDITSGGTALPGTGDIDEYDADARFDWRLSKWWSLTAAYQRVRQFDAPRTERTVDSVPFEGTEAGSELRRDFDQERDLAYVKLSFDAGKRPLPISRGHIAVSYHRHFEERDRLRTGGRRDLSGFTVEQFGIQAQLTSCTRLGELTYGVEYTHDEVDSFRRNFRDGIEGTPGIQGPLGDDGAYDLVGAYVQDHVRWGAWEWTAGARFTYAAAAADRVDNPAVGGSDPATPDNIIAIDNEWTNVVGSLRGVYHVNKSWNVYASASQGFRTPTLYDLTSLDSTSVVETPAPDLEPEEYLSFELGVKTEQSKLRAELAAWYTILNDTIVRSPTGTLIDGTPEVRKDNIGDGFLWGLEFSWAWTFRPCWTWFGAASLTVDGEVDQLDETGTLVRAPLSRMKPLTAWTGVRFENPRFWAQADVEFSDDEDRLSFRDQADTRRIPPGGTPGWTVFNLRAGYRLNRRTALSVAVENVTDENYRIHGSGQNEPGRNFVVALDMDF